MALTPAGVVEGWGDNFWGQRTPFSGNSDFLMISGGELHSLGLKSGGIVAAWGRDLEDQLVLPSPNLLYSQVAAGGFHSLARHEDGFVSAWGRNTAGQTNVPAPNTNFGTVVAGRNHSLGLKPGGVVVAWGRNANGQLNVPAPNTNFLAVAGGGEHSLGLKADGSIIGWGLNTDGQLNVPGGNSNFIAVAAGYDHSVGLKNDGTVVVWGSDLYGQLQVPSPNANFVAITANGYHTVALRADGTLAAWGRNNSGQTNINPTLSYGIRTSGVSPASGSQAGSFPVTISGVFLKGDITNATLAGIEVEAILSQSSTQLVVLAGPASGPLLGDIRAYSTDDGELISTDTFRYLGEQTIAFSELSGQTTTSNVGLAATATSELPVSFAVASGPGQIVSGTNLSFTATGEVVIIASQAGSEAWFPAPDVARTVIVEKATATIELIDLVQTFNGTPRNITALTTPPGLTVNIFYDDEPAAPVNAGSYLVTASIDDPLFLGGAIGTLTITKAVAGISLGGTNVVYNGMPQEISVTTTPLDLPFVIDYDGSPDAPVNAGSYPVTVSVNDSNYTGSVTGAVVIAQASQSISFASPGTQWVTNQVGLAASASSGLPVSFAIGDGPGVITDGTNLTFTGAGFVLVIASQPGDTNWLAASDVGQEFQILRLPQTINFTTPPTLTQTDTFGLAATASSGLSVSFSIADGPGSLLDGTNLSFSATGLVRVVASQPGNAIWAAAPAVTNIIEVTAPALFQLDVLAGPNGSVDTLSGPRTAGELVTITALPDPYYLFLEWTGDVPPGAENDNPLDLLMDDDKSVSAVFAPQTTSGGIPLPWLVSFGITNDFEAAVLLDHDDDGVPTGEEYIADTDPTDPTSFLAVASLGTAPAAGVVLTAPASTARVYSVSYRLPGPGAPWTPLDSLTNLVPVSSSLSVTSSPALPASTIYRFEVRLP
ncbi:MAG TPA: MBG domain-containing protein [Kiritimatiellia bacterium]|nr:MBG domain-containing protein [Kiritimatiellia bacterium]